MCPPTSPLSHLGFSLPCFDHSVATFGFFLSFILREHALLWFILKFLCLILIILWFFFTNWFILREPFASLLPFVVYFKVFMFDPNHSLVLLICLF